VAAKDIREGKTPSTRYTEPN